MRLEAGEEKRNKDVEDKKGSMECDGEQTDLSPTRDSHSLLYMEKRKIVHCRAYFAASLLTSSKPRSP